MSVRNSKVNLRKAQAEERRLQILNTALEVFASQGFAGTSIKDIAEAADISQGLMYHYFPSKEALLSATIEHFSFLPQLRQILSEPGNLPVKEVIKDIGIKFLNMLEEKRLLVSILLKEVEFSPEVNNTWAEICREGVSVLKKFLDSRIASGELRPHKSEVVARSLFSQVVMLHFTRNVFKDNRTSREEYINETLKNLLQGIGQN